MIPDGPPSAEGLLEKTPFSHLLVYALDRQLTGELFLEEPSGRLHVIRLDLGVPTKLRVSDDFLRLGDLLVEQGLCARESVEGAAMTGGLLGDLLVLTGCVETEALNRVLEEQFLGRMKRAFSLEKDTTFKYFDKSSVLAEWGGEPSGEDPISLIWAGLREHAGKSTSFEATLARLGDRPLVLHPRAPTSRLKLDESCGAVVDSLADAATLEELIARGLVLPETCRRIVYALVILRQLDLGGAGAPVGVRDARPASLAKVQLKSETHRVGAAVDAKMASRSRKITVGGRQLIPRDDAPQSVHPPPVDESTVDSPASEVPSSEMLAAAMPPSLGSEAFDASDIGAIDAGVIETSEEEIDPALLEEEGLEAAAASDVTASLEPSAPDAPVRDTTPDDDDASNASPATETMADAAESEESSRRIVPEALRALEPEALKAMAEEKLLARESTAALQVCDAALGKLRALEGDAGPEGLLFHEITSLAASARSLEPQANLKVLTMELDELIRARDDVALTRAVRGRVRRRLGDTPGATSDYRRVLELAEVGSSLETEAKRELIELEPKVGRGQTGFLKRLFKR